MEKTSTTTEWLQVQLSEIYHDLTEVNLRLTDAEIDELARIDAARHGTPHEL